jgi:carbon-monoxide dehydrogenase large subunit
MVCGPYRIGAQAFTLEGVFTTTAPIVAYRGIARAELAYLLERLVDAAARQTGIERIELRRRNLIAPAQMPYRSATGALFPPAQFERNLDRGLATIDWAGFAGRRAAAAECGRLRGIGVAVYLENAGGTPSEFAQVQVEAAGTIALRVGTQDFGMGHATVFAQVLADVLGVDPETIAMIDGDTELIASGAGGHGSRCARLGGGAVVEGGRAVIERGRPLAAELLEAAASDLEFNDGAYVVRGTDRRIGLFAVARAAAERGLALDASATFATAGPSYPNGCQLCEVEIDPETGAVRIVRHVMVADPGRVINPNDRRRPAPRRHRPGHRPSAARAGRLRPRHRPAAVGQLHGLRPAPRRRSAGVHARAQSRRERRQSAWRQGHRREPDHRRAARGGQRRARRARHARGHHARHAAHARARLARARRTRLVRISRREYWPPCPVRG